MLKFCAKIEICNGNPYVLVTADQAAILHQDWRRPMPVRIWVNGQPQVGWRINMMPIGNGDFYLYLHGDVRKASQTVVGDKVTVIVEFDKTYKNGPQHEMPDWFNVPLNKNEKAYRNWVALPPSRQKEILRYFSWLKSDSAKQRNVEKALFVLSGKKGRFMARDWVDGR